jgi:hypothetical protein
MELRVKSIGSLISWPSLIPASFCKLKWMPRMLVANPTEEFYMADTVKKTKAPAKPRKTAVKNAPAEATPSVVMPSQEEIRRLAAEYWAQRGFQDGYAEQDWFRAEQELRQKAS